MSHLKGHVDDLDVVAAPLAEELDLRHLRHDGGRARRRGGVAALVNVVPVLVSHGWNIVKSNLS